MSQAEALQRIKKAARTGERTLILAGLGLKSLPPDLANLTHLTELLLFHNRLTSHSLNGCNAKCK